MASYLEAGDRHRPRHNHARHTAQQCCLVSRGQHENQSSLPSNMRHPLPLDTSVLHRFTYLPLWKQAHVRITFFWHLLILKTDSTNKNDTYRTNGQPAVFPLAASVFPDSSKSKTELAKDSKYSNITPTISGISTTTIYEALDTR